jgi:hypothetical protein
MGSKAVDDEGKPIRKTISASVAAKELGVHLGTLVGWAQDGHLRMFVPPGKRLGDGKRGPKGYMIWLVDWEAFKAAHTVTGIKQPVATALPDPMTELPTGPDGIRRRNQNRHRRLT